MDKGFEEIDNFGRSQLFYAIADKDLNAVKQLLKKGFDPKLIDQNGMTSLHMAAWHLQTEAAQILLQAGAQVNVIDRHGNNELWYAFHFGAQDAPDLVRLYLSHGSDPNHKNRAGRSVADMARITGNLNFPELLK